MGTMDVAVERVTEEAWLSMTCDCGSCHPTATVYRDDLHYERHESRLAQAPCCCGRFFVVGEDDETPESGPGPWPKSCNRRAKLQRDTTSGLTRSLCPGEARWRRYRPISANRPSPPMARLHNIAVAHEAATPRPLRSAMGEDKEA